MTEHDVGVTLSAGGEHLLRSATRARRDAALRFASGAALDDGHAYTVRRLGTALGASRVFLATWSDTAHVGRVLVGAPPDEQRSFNRRPLPALPSESTRPGEPITITAMSGLTDTYPWLAELARSDELVLGVGTWAGRHPVCVLGIAGVDRLDDDTLLVIEDFLLMFMGTAAAEILVRQRNEADRRRGEALDTLVSELDGERRRISHQIHDDVLQSVSSIAHFLETLTATTESANTRRVLERLRSEAQNSAITLRRIVNEFEPEQEAEESLTAQIRSLAARVTDLFGLAVTVDVGPGVDDVALAQPALRVLRQALDNVVTHADATTAHVAASMRAPGELTLTVDDDGRAKDHPWDHGVGLRSMKRIVDEHGGVLSVGPTQHHGGTRVSATFPINGASLGPHANVALRAGRDLDDSEFVAAVRRTTQSMLDGGQQPTISSVAESLGLARRDLLSRYGSADAMIADAVNALVISIEARWAAFGQIDLNAPLEARLDALIERRFAMEEWGRPLRVHTPVVDPSSRFDDEVLTAFRAELSAMGPAERENTGRLLAWLFRVRTIRAIVSDRSVVPSVARTTIRSVATTLLTN